MRTSMIAASLVLALMGATTAAHAASFSAWGHEFDYPNEQQVAQPDTKGLVALERSGHHHARTTKLLELSASHR